MNWLEVKSHILFPTSSFLHPIDDRTFSGPDRKLVLKSLEMVYETVAGKAVLDMLVDENRDVDIRQGIGTGSETLRTLFFGVSNNIVLDLADANRVYLGLDGLISSSSSQWSTQPSEQLRLGTILLHEIFHTFGNYDVRPDGKSATARDCMDPEFDHIGKVDRAINVVRAELGISERGAYQSIPVNKIDYLKGMSGFIRGVYDQSFMLTLDVGQDGFAYFDSSLKREGAAPSRDLVVGLSSRNDIATGIGNDVLVGYRFGDRLYGGGNDDRLYGLAGADSIYGGTGIDRLFGGIGDDLYTVNTVRDIVTEQIAEGNDTISSANISLNLLSYACVENILLAGSSNLDAMGNSIANRILGNSGENIITGGRGIDTLTGGSGNDTFVYFSPNEGGDNITDFRSGVDQLLLKSSGLPAGKLNASFFHVGSTNKAVDGNDYFVFRMTDCTIWFDVDGNGAATPMLAADLQVGATLTASDIIFFL